MGMSSKIATASMRLVAERVQRCMHVMEGGGATAFLFSSYKQAVEVPQVYWLYTL